MAIERQVAGEWRSGWPLVLTTGVGLMGTAAPTYMLGVMMKPLSAAFGWSRAEVSSCMFLWAMSSLLFSAAVGALIDRFGPRRVALIGAPLAGLALAAAGATGPNVWTWHAVWAIYGPLSITVCPLLWGSALARHFNASRGFALALGLCGAGLGAALWPPLTAWLTQGWGWRTAFYVNGALMSGVLTLCVIVLFRGPATQPRLKTEKAATANAPGLSLQQAVRTTVFWRVALMLMVVASAVSSIAVHLSALLMDKGLSPLEAASTAAALGPALIVGRLLGGAALDRFPARFVALVCLLAPLTGCLLLTGFDGNRARGVAAACLIGMASGMESDLLAFLLSRYFGLHSFGAIYGAGLSLFGLGIGVAPMIGGLLFDKLGSYDLGLMTLAGVLFLCVPVALTLGRYPDHGAADESGDAAPVGAAPTVATA